MQLPQSIDGKSLALLCVCRSLLLALGGFPFTPSLLLSPTFILPATCRWVSIISFPCCSCVMQLGEEPALNADSWLVLPIQNVHLKLTGISLPPNTSLMFPHTAYPHTAYLSPKELASKRIHEMEVLLLHWQIFSALHTSLLYLHHVLGPKEGKICSEKALRVTSDGSWTHWPSTKNLYWCSPSGRSRIATKSLWLCRENRCTTPLLQ